MDRLNKEIIPLARIVRTHGVPKLGVCTFKADLFSVGGEIFKNKTEVYLSSNALPLTFGLESSTGSPLKITWDKVKLDEAIAPHGGTFGRAKSILVRLSRGEAELRGHLIGLGRDEFPLLEKEFYVTDLIGLQVANENEKIVGTITGFEDNSFSNVVASVNLFVKTKSGKGFSFPSQWISYEDYSAALASEKNILKVSGIEEWMIDASSANDERE